MSILNWVLGLASLVCIVLLLIGPLATIIAALVEGNKTVAPGTQRSWKKTKLFAILSGAGFFGLFVILVLWGIAAYVTNVTSFGY